MKGRELVFGARAIGAIAVNTFREAVRNKIFGALVFFAIGVLAFSLVLGEMSVHNEVRVATNIALFSSTLFSMVLTVYVSINLLHTEIERRTIYTILSKPVHRWQFLLGKFLGIIALMGTVVLLLFGLSSGLRLFQGGQLSWAFGGAFFAIFLQIVITAAISLLLASFSSPLLSGLLSSGIFLLGHLHPQLDVVQNFFEIATFRTFFEVLKFLLPNLSSLNLSTEIVHHVPITAHYIVSAGWYTLSYAGIVLVFSMIIFGQRDLL